MTRIEAVKKADPTVSENIVILGYCPDDFTKITGVENKLKCDNRCLDCWNKPIQKLNEKR